MAYKPKGNSQKYAGIGFQLIIVTFVIIGVGRFLDNYYNLESVFLLIAIFIAVFAVIYLLIKKLQ
jgi:hypothetical protein